MNESAMSADEQRRREQEASQVLAKSIGIQDAEGNQLHGRERTERARNLRDEMKAAARDQRAGLTEEQRTTRADERTAARQNDTVRVSINAPHRATVRGNQIALQIAKADGGGIPGNFAPRPTVVFVNGVIGVSNVMRDQAIEA